MTQKRSRNQRSKQNKRTPWEETGHTNWDWKSKNNRTMREQEEACYREMKNGASGGGEREG